MYEIAKKNKPPRDSTQSTTQGGLYLVLCR